ncbi:PREDICTED: protoporphyrinogen oxidase-like [Wasmannia auropunctata]|uniref:protoporphyrinogen oxidase-like n=1 Tax=Wasmannia auropunctata TaxID=64793 RepID=UPI0005F0A504|nr:PREDICTED: protoporphyrinogen oxidase-like [Wasmannia auropunctata]
MTIIIGGGISGLSAAYYALKNAKLSSVILLEASNRLGGWIRSRSSPSGAIFEQGPRIVKMDDDLDENHTLKLAMDLQLSDKLIRFGPLHPAVENELIYKNKKLYDRPPIILTSIANRYALKHILKLRGLYRPIIKNIWMDLMVPKVAKEDENVYSFFERRLGKNFTDDVISPLMCGIYAGDAHELSIKCIEPYSRVFEVEQEHGSIFKLMVKNFLAEQLLKRFSVNKNSEKDNADDGIAARPTHETLAETLALRILYGGVWGLRGGLEQLPQALADDVKRRGAKIQTGKRCEKLIFKSDHVELSVNGELQECSRVISSLCAKDLAELLQEQHPGLSAELKAIPTVTVGLVNLEFQGNVLPQEAFSIFISPKENLPLLSVTFDSCINSESSTVLRVMMGGPWFEKYFGPNPSEEQLLSTAIKHTKSILQIDEEPVAHNVAILKDCIPQYVVGHNARVKRIYNYIFTHNIPLALCGSSYQGLELNDIIRLAKQAVT